jgi:hypothetical protein
MTRFSFSLAVVACTLLSFRPGWADIKQPNGQTIPDPVIGCDNGQPGGLGGVFACVCDAPGVCNIGKPCPGGSTSCDPGQNATCETTIWHSVNDNTCIPSNLSGLDPRKDAAVKPETFRPVCGLNFTLVSRGAAMFKNVFGWYNVAPGGKKPDPSDLHALIQCGTTNGTTIPLNVLSEPAYKGGDIGFFIATPEDPSKKGACAKGDCCATVPRATSGEGYVYYSQPQFNPDNKGASSTIHLLIYNSRITQYKYYFAWEDTFDGTSNNFSDFVTAVSGISCSGGGVKCPTGKPGLCAFGVTKCVDDGKVTCEASNSASPEACDGLDNDCNGKVDDGATCPDEKRCYQGACVGSCQTSQEFACQTGYECDAVAGFCVDIACEDKSCQTSEICRGGTCGNGCDGILCPGDQVCQSGVCVNLCAGRLCKQGQVCKLGVCLESCLGCGGITCTGGLACHAKTGDCYDPSCSPECGPGTVCRSGTCKDLCEGVVCPGGMACLPGGICPPPGVGKGKVAPGVDAGPPGVPPDGTPPLPNPDGGAVDLTGGKSGCSCSLAARPEDTGSGDLGGLFSVLALLGWAWWRRAA